MKQQKLSIDVTVNGEVFEQSVEPRTTLAELLRDALQLTGTKVGCEHGVCGACTVLLDGASVRSCLTLAAQVDGREVTTVEGLSNGRELSALQESFRKHHALQCGFCTAGFLVTATELLESSDDLDERGVRTALSGNICRCTGYETIVDAILDVSAGARSER